MPYTNVTGDLKAANYSSIRAGTVEFRRRMDQFQHATLIYQLCRPVWKRWLETVALSGALSMPGFASDPTKYAAVKWITPKWEWVDPLKDRQAEKIAQECGWKAPSDIIEAEGNDVDETYNRIAADQKRREELGIKLGQPAPTPATPPEQTAPDAPDQQAQDQTATDQQQTDQTA
jgi:lambda family phage portal protein